MKNTDYDTLSQAMNQLTKEGYTDSFSAEENYIKALYAKKEYNPKDLKIDQTFRFDGMTNPADETELFAISANDGTQGTLTMSYSSENNHNRELIKQIK
ncbi:phosphoribosylpyrophosphate synthetase [Wenyingzhuangia sp. 2_MG-2023]|uniref:phosphoribosylpyrophosphate synthetase n=1 Tax=Wenyingzhuangia sp. 2_MG-2023 TaxID=3062639 RepID=UPI0026E17A43|nr:phosphoribosylpyrophosphate synthetase [Wenyingzhuangia sp. 2_MG-2023]MDO6739215.1 phosphoribosylpyrophosphate synthetase [Wenyingzhuangia sp. 2_MG-2023]MDO6803784.1 phosphoribosylpyrophosphate synthetase [Wenyingzhuangia sp. 1_MG-2023]